MYRSRLGSVDEILTERQNRKADWVIFTEVMETGEKIFIRDVTKIERDWLTEYAPEFYRRKDIK